MSNLKKSKKNINIDEEISIIKKYQNEQFELNIKGSKINYIIINTIRRAILTYVPIYAFTQFNFIKNESIFNNNYIKLHLNNFLVLGIENNLVKIEKKNSNEIIEEDTNDVEINDIINTNEEIEEKEKNNSTINQLTMYINYTSKEKKNITVTTDDVKFYYKEKNIKSPYKIPIPIIDLQPGQTINFSAITSVGTEKESAIFSPVSVCYYHEINENEFDFIIESRGQLKEERILEVAILNLIEVIEKILYRFNTNDKYTKGEILINGENNTIGNLLSYGLQTHKKIKFAGYNIPHLLDEKVLITYELYDNESNIKEILTEVIHNLIKLFKKILIN
jgi:DNA-directed RNA polymerase subunit L